MQCKQKKVSYLRADSLHVHSKSHGYSKDSQMLPRWASLVSCIRLQLVTVFPVRQTLYLFSNHRKMRGWCHLTFTKLLFHCLWQHLRCACHKNVSSNTSECISLPRHFIRKCQVLCNSPFNADFHFTTWVLRFQLYFPHHGSHRVLQRDV